MEAWIPNFGTGIPLSWPDAPCNLRVSDFIREDRSWDAPKLHEIFPPVSVNAILLLSIPKTMSAYISRWIFDDKGTFTVKSGYLVDMGYFDSLPTRYGTHNKDWNHLIWSLRIAPKIKIFFWWAINDFIPLAMNLRSHHVPVSGTCEVCKKDCASTTHGLLFCTLAKRVWKNSNFSFLFYNCKARSFGEIVRLMRKKLNKSNFEVWVVTLWMLWNEICQKKHSNGENIYETNIDRAASFLKEFQKAKNDLASNIYMGIDLGDRRWIPPKFGVLRLDMDAMFHAMDRKFGVGVVFCNHLGIIVVASSKQILQPGNVLEAEIQAVLHGISLCIQLQVRPVEIYTDSILAAQILVDKRGEHYAIKDEQRKILTSSHFILSINHVFRSANFVAHSLADYSVSVSSEMLWTFDFPTWLCNIAARDLEH